MLDVGQRVCVVVGGGPVGRRKAEGLAKAGAKNVRVVGREISGKRPAGVKWVRQAYQKRHLKGAGLVFAATDDPRVNAAVARDARELGIPVCRADEGQGDFTVPAVLRKGAVTVAVWTGRTPALAAAIRDGLEDKFDERWRQMAEAMKILRPVALKSERKREILRALATEEAMAVLARGGLKGLKRWVRGRFG
jgi:precorrin-2 dehydrogenase / sirohydrochlorin ferrochelatase